MGIKLASLAKGVLSYVPGFLQLLPEETATKPHSVEYCYGVWLKHLTLLRASGMQGIPMSVAELGPHDSLGVGLCALLSGCTRYSGLDVVAYANATGNLNTLDELLDLFSRRAPRPTKGWPDFDALLGADLFPHHILTDEILAASLAPKRVQRIRRALCDPEGVCEEFTIRYFAPWNDPGVMLPGTVDLLLSHAVLQHVRELDSAYAAMRQWLRPGGYMSHQIDLTSLLVTTLWNGHYAVPAWIWLLARGRKQYYASRLPLSVHLALLQKNGFRLIDSKTIHRSGGIARASLAREFRDLSAEDLATSGALLQAIRSGD